MTGLEHGYRRLLRAYPAWYRRERGEEIMDTLLAAAPRGRTWPSLRDCGALILGGLRVRAGQNRRLTTAANLRLAVLFGVALWLTRELAVDLVFAGQGLFAAQGSLHWAYAGQGSLHWIPPGQPFAYAAFRGLVMLVAVGAAWFAPRPVVAAISLTAVAAISLIAVATDAYPWQGPWWLLGEPAMLAGLALLALGTERMPRNWLWLLGVVLALQMLSSFEGWGFYHQFFFLFPWLNGLVWAILAAVVLWAAVDGRPLIAAGVCVALGRAIPLATGWYDTGLGGDHASFWPLAWGAVLVLVMTLRLRRQAVL